MHYPSYFMTICTMKDSYEFAVVSVHNIKRLYLQSMSYATTSKYDLPVWFSLTLLLGHK
jgi:hypothetical protein